MPLLLFCAALADRICIFHNFLFAKVQVERRGIELFKGDIYKLNYIFQVKFSSNLTPMTPSFPRGWVVDGSEQKE